MWYILIGCIENYKNILEYQDILIKVNTFEGVVTIYGFNLKLDEMTEDNLKITGKIENMDFEKRGLNNVF